MPARTRPHLTLLLFCPPITTRYCAGSLTLTTRLPHQTLSARQRFVRVGERRGDFVAVTSGLGAGETVVSSGAFKLRNGAAVVVNNELAPKAEVAPTPVDQ